MKLRSSVSQFTFDPATFAQLSAALRAGSLSPESAKLSDPPRPLGDAETGVLRSPLRLERSQAAIAAMRAGKLGVLVLNGGMATRFGGVPKGIVPVLEDHDESFLFLKLAQILAAEREFDAQIPVTLMHSFATRRASDEHLKKIRWAGLCAERCHSFDQSIMPRVTPDGSPIAERADANDLSDTQLYSAPGHGDTLRMLRLSGVLAKLRAQGVEHLLVSNVDNLGASADPRVFSAHLEACAAGAAMSVEVVRREPDDAGGCIACVEERPVIVEGFRLPKESDLSRFPHFNTNTLWFDLAALEEPLSLSWFPVHRSLPVTKGETIPMVQFEQLIGQATELLPANYIEVEREARFLPIKTRDDLRAAAPSMAARIAATQRHPS